MNKQSALEQIKQAAFEEELEKIASGLSPKTLASAARKAVIRSATTTSMPGFFSFGQGARQHAANIIKDKRKTINMALEKIKGTKYNEIYQKYGRTPLLSDPGIGDIAKEEIKIMKRHVLPGIKRNIPSNK